MLCVVKTVVLSAGNTEEIAISSKYISSLMHFIAGIYSICPPRWLEVIAGIYIYIPYVPRELIIEPASFKAGKPALKWASRVYNQALTYTSVESLYSEYPWESNVQESKCI